MPAQRLAMRQVHEVLRLKWEQGLSDRKIAHSLGMSRPTVAEYVRRAQAAGLAWPLPATYDEVTLERLLFPAVSTRAPAPYLVPDWAKVHQELKRKGQYLRRLNGVASMVNPPQCSHFGHHLINKIGIGRFRKQF